MKLSKSGGDQDAADRRRRGQALPASSGLGTPLLRRLPQQAVPACLLSVVVLTPLVEIANGIAAPLLAAAARALLLRVLVAGLWAVLVLLAAARAYPPDLRGAQARWAHPFLFALLVWCLLSYRASPDRPFAEAELLRVLLCLGVYGAAAYGLRPGQVPLTVGGLVLIGAGMAADGLRQFGAAQTQGGPPVFDHTLGLFGDSENLGSFLMLLFILSLPPALGRELPELPRLGAQACSMLLLITLALTCTRAAWIGGIAALLVLGWRWPRSRTLAPSQRGDLKGPRGLLRPSAAPAVLILTALLLVLTVSGTGWMVSRRALSLANVTHLESFTDRLHKSGAACRAASERPLTGWGLGAWPVLQWRWTQEGDTARQVTARQDVWSRGLDQQDLAHDFWAQWAADTGGIGLALYVAAIAAFLLTALRALPHVGSPARRGTLLSCVAAVIGSCVDALGSPAYSLPGVSLVPWLCMGLGVAACREGRAGPAAWPPTRPDVWGLALAVGALAASAALAVGDLSGPFAG